MRSAGWSGAAAVGPGAWLLIWSVWRRRLQPDHQPLEVLARRGVQRNLCTLVAVVSDPQVVGVRTQLEREVACGFTENRTGSCEWTATPARRDSADRRGVGGHQAGPVEWLAGLGVDDDSGDSRRGRFHLDADAFQIGL